MQTSPGPNIDATCYGPRGACRWGDYSGASPDPTPGRGGTGKVWLTNEWNVLSENDDNYDWRTWNWTVVTRHR